MSTFGKDEDESGIVSGSRLSARKMTSVGAVTSNTHRGCGI